MFGKIKCINICKLDKYMPRGNQKYVMKLDPILDMQAMLCKIIQSNFWLKYASNVMQIYPIKLMTKICNQSYANLSNKTYDYKICKQCYANLSNKTYD